jgi:hypothetical protein
MIPMIGPYLGVAPAVLVALTISPTTALILIGYAVLIQSIEGYVLVPRVLGHAVGVSPLVVFVGILVGFALGGFVGAFLAVPVAGALQVILQDLLSPDSEVAEDAQEAGAPVATPEAASGGARLAVVAPHAHPVLPGGVIADASGTGAGAPVHSRAAEPPRVITPGR